MIRVLVPHATAQMDSTRIAGSRQSLLRLEANMCQAVLANVLQPLCGSVLNPSDMNCAQFPTDGRVPCVDEALKEVPA